MLYDELISICKKEYNQTFKSKDKDWRQIHDHKNLKDLDWKPDQLRPDQLQPDQLVQPKKVKVTKYRFDEMQSMVTGAKSNNLKTSVN